MPAPRLLELDILRGFAILLVLGHHVPAYPIWSTAGWLGVDLFFVLSGFLISNLLFTEYRLHGSISLKRFYLRRALKIYPSFYFLLIATVAYCLIRGVPFTARQLLGELILTQNYIGGIWGHTWSLAVEEHFYLLLPFALAMMIRARRGQSDPFRSIPWMFLCVAAFCLAARYWNAYHAPYSHRIHFELSHVRFDSLLFGVLLSYLHNFRPALLETLMRSNWRLPICMLGVLALFPSIVNLAETPLVYTIGFTLAYLGFGSVLLLTLYPEKRSPRPGRVARAIGAMGVYSYGIYLWHVPLAMVFAAIDRALDSRMNPFLLHALYCAASIVTGVALSKLIEIPMLHLRDRLLPSRSVQPPAPVLVTMAE